MFENFFDQVDLADSLGFGTAWVAETHLSCEIQKQLPDAVIPHFKGEIGLNTDILQMAHKIFARTRHINVGSAIRNILCNGGPVAHAEAIRTFLMLHGLRSDESRRINIGFASGRFEFSNRPYGIVPRTELEQAAWPVVKGKILAQATEIFLRLLKGERMAIEGVPPMRLSRKELGQFPRALEILKGESETLKPYWNFEKLGVIPFDAPLSLLDLTIGTHDPQTQILANQFLPVGVFNLSITPPAVIEETHQRMKSHFHSSGGPWRRWYMPRTAMVFFDRDQARAAWENYWIAMEGTLDPRKVEQAVGNALVGEPEEIVELIRSRYHPEDRLMLWFDFNIHDNDLIKSSMRRFMENVAPHLSGGH